MQHSTIIASSQSATVTIPELKKKIQAAQKRAAEQVNNSIVERRLILIEDILEKDAKDQGKNRKQLETIYQKRFEELPYGFTNSKNLELMTDYTPFPDYKISQSLTYIVLNTAPTAALNDLISTNNIITIVNKKLLSVIIQYQALALLLSEFFTHEEANKLFDQIFSESGSEMIIGCTNSVLIIKSTDSTGPINPIAFFNKQQTFKNKDTFQLDTETIFHLLNAPNFTLKKLKIHQEIHTKFIHSGLISCQIILNLPEFAPQEIQLEKDNLLTAIDTNEKSIIPTLLTMDNTSSATELENLKKQLSELHIKIHGNMEQVITFMHYLLFIHLRENIDSKQIFNGLCNCYFKFGRICFEKLQAPSKALFYFQMQREIAQLLYTLYKEEAVAKALETAKIAIIKTQALINRQSLSNTITPTHVTTAENNNNSTEPTSASNVNNKPKEKKKNKNKFNDYSQQKKEEQPKQQESADSDIPLEDFARGMTITQKLKQSNNQKKPAQ